MMVVLAYKCKTRVALISIPELNLCTIKCMKIMIILPSHLAASIGKLRLTSITTRTETTQKYAMRCTCYKP